MITTEQILEILKPAEVLVKSSNYIQYIDAGGNFTECQKDYVQKKWYLFQSVGNSDSPLEIFHKWVE